MENYKVLVWKNGKKHTIVFKSDNEKSARNRVYNEGYSILSIEKTNINHNLGDIFVFIAYNKKGKFKKGKIEGTDIFKVYVKLRKNLEYNVKSLYHESDINLGDEEKKKIILDLNDEFNIIFSKNKERELINKKNIAKKENKNNSNFYLKKELEEIYKLINFVLIKIEKLLQNKTGISITSDEQIKLKTIFNSITRLKKSSNINKLKEIGEIALLKIGRIELNNLEVSNSKATKKLLKETNYLLKKNGSNKNFIEKEKDIYLILNKILLKISNIFIIKEKKEKVDKLSHSYVKNKLILNKYKEKLKENNFLILKNLLKIFINKELRTDLFINRYVLKQNIVLLLAKEKGVLFSYTFIKKGFSKILIKFDKCFIDFNKYIFTIIFLYSSIFIIYIIFFKNIDILEYSHKGISYFIVLLFIYLILKLHKKIILFLLNFVFLFFIVIFGLVNF